MKCKCASRSWVLVVSVSTAMLLGSALVPGGQSARAVDWTWMKGRSVANWAGTYGTLGTPAEANAPGGRYDATSCIDSSGALWLFGGYGSDSAFHYGKMNDLWMYSTSTGNWVWVAGSNTFGGSGVYGTQGTPASSNTPGARENPVSWIGPRNVFWMFGGSGLDGAGNVGQLNDLWRHDMHTGNWTWVKGSSARNQAGTYGTVLTEAAANTPGARGDAVSCTDASGGMWLFGGYGNTATGSLDRLNDLWKFNPGTGNWAWMKGSGAGSQAGVYGERGTADAANTPGSRMKAAGCADSSGAIWVFGGYGYGHDYTDGNLSDLWKYDPASGNWTWMRGPYVPDQKGTYGTQGTPTGSTIPGARTDCVLWADMAGMIWLFGGYGLDATGSLGQLNDLWQFDPVSCRWTWMKGSTTIGASGNYGVMGTPGAAGTPGARYMSTGWSDPYSGGLWLFGGLGFDASASSGYLNDLWRIALPDTLAPTGGIVINDNNSVTNNVKVTLALHWADMGGSGAVRMKFSNDAVIWTAWEALAATKAWTLSAGEGYHTVRAMFRDKAGNNSVVYNDYIRLDTIPPTGSIIINKGDSSTKNRAVSLGLTWSDGTGSGVARMRFSIDGAHWTAWEYPVTPKSYTLPSTPQYYTVRVQYLDAANNYSPVYTDYIKLLAP